MNWLAKREREREGGGGVNSLKQTRDLHIHGGGGDLLEDIFIFGVWFNCTEVLKMEETL